MTTGKDNTSTVECAGVFCVSGKSYPDIRPEPFPLEVKVDLPEGWASWCASIDCSVYCPACAAEMEFFSEQCPGCVESYPECEFTQRVESGDVHDRDMAAIRKGICPFRTNGTLMVHDGGRRVESVDLSSPATVGGSAVAVAFERLRQRQGG